MRDLFQRRQREASKAGSPPKLTEKIPAQARAQLVHCLTDHVVPESGSQLYRYSTSDWEVLNGAILRIVVRAWGAPSVAHNDVRNLLLNGTDGEVLDIVEAWFPATDEIAAAMQQYSGGSWVSGREIVEVVKGIAERYVARTNDIFDDRDVAWQLVRRRIVPRSSASLHREIVEPVMALTSGDRRLDGVERAFQKALLELKPNGDPADAITDAAAALQEMLEAAGARGNALGPLLKDARKRELLGPYDNKLTEAIELLGDWVSADRSARGDAHHSRETRAEDAWLTVRVVGALILRLAGARKR